MTAVADRLKGALFLTCGLALACGAAFAARGATRFLAQSVTVPGLVVAERDGPTHVDVRFTTRAGRTVTYFQGGDVFVRRGERVTVRYAPNDPQGSPALDTFGAIWGTTAGIGGLGLVFTVVGAFALFSRPAGTERVR